MLLSREEVNSLYLICLGRPVESDLAARDRAHQSIEECAVDLLCSHEFDALVFQPIMEGKDLPHNRLPPDAFNSAKNFALNKGSYLFHNDASSYEEWYSLVLDIIDNQKIYSFFADKYKKHDLFIELVKICQKRNVPFIGIIEEINSIRCRGYILDTRDPSRDLALRLRLNGTTVALVPALQFRRNIQDKHGGNGRTGFEINFENLPAFSGLSSGIIEITEYSSGFLLLENYKLSFSQIKTIETRDLLLNNLKDLRHTIDDLIERIDGRHENQIVSLGGYGHARSFTRRPKPPVTKIRLAILVDARDKPISEDFAESLVNQSHAALWIGVIGNQNDINIAVKSVFQNSELSLYQIEDINDVSEICKKAEAEHILMISPTEFLESDALAWFAYTIGLSGARIAYADSEVENINSSNLPRIMPIFRSALDPELLFTSDEYDGPLCISKDMILDNFNDIEAADFRLTILLRCLEHQGRNAFRHIPLVLSRSINFENLEPNNTRRQNIVEAHLKRICPTALLAPHADFVTGPIVNRFQVFWPTNPKIGISIIIPTRDSIDMVISLIASLKERTAILSLLKIYVVNNNSRAPQTPKALEILNKDDIVKVIEWNEDFNWAALNDKVIRECDDDDIIVCLNNDIICMTDAWDNLLRGQLARSDVNIVGGRLLYANGMIQHAGVAMVGVWLHEGLGDDPSHGLYRDRTRIAHECAAVTGAFMAFTKEFYLKIGGFNIEHFPVSYNDVEFCIRAERFGARILYDPNQVWIHFESETRGFDENDPVKQDKDNRARQRALKMLPRSDYRDLSINPHFSQHARPFSIISWPRREEILSWIDQQSIRHADRLLQ